MSGYTRVRDLPVSSRFAWRGEVWKVDHNEPSFVEARAEQFSNRATFYDAVTARKSGDLCWDVTVEALS